jgi:prepilin-type processing-associated H-X9-DG protein
MQNVKRLKSVPDDKRAAFTVIELVVCAAILALLVALLLPAVQGTREASRKMQCAANLRQIGIAISAYESAHGMFPPGGSYGASLHVSLLPFLDQSPLYKLYDFAKRDDSAVRFTKVPLYLCPSDPAPVAWPATTPGEIATSYAGNAGTGVLKYGYNGMFRHISAASPPLRDGPIRAQDVFNGMSNTAAVSEILFSDGSFTRLRVTWNSPQRFSTPGEQDEFAAYCADIPPAPHDFGWQGDTFGRGRPWTKGDISYTMYNHVLGPNQPSCFNKSDVQTAIVSAGSAHAGGVNLLYADGHLTFAAQSIDSAVWRGLGSRVESDLIGAP